MLMMVKRENQDQMVLRDSLEILEYREKKDILAKLPIQSTLHRVTKVIKVNKENQVMLEPMATQEVTAMLVLLESPVQMVLRVYQVCPDLMEPREIKVNKEIKVL